LGSIQQQKKWFKQELFEILNPIIKDAETFTVSNLEYLKLFNIEDASTVQNIWKHLYELTKPNIHESHHEALDVILTQGTLATRILKAVGNDYSEKNITKVYTQLAQCLQDNTMFEP
jgi:carboxylate-amine ligase